MLEDGHSATERLAPQDEVIAGFLRDGLRPVEIAVRMGLPVSEVHARIERLSNAAQPLAPASEPAPTATLIGTGAEDGHGRAEPVSRVPLLVLGVVAAVFVVAMAVFLAVESRQAGERAVVAGDGGPGVIVQPTVPVPTPVTVDGVRLEPVRLGAESDLPHGVAVTVHSFCSRCAPLTTYIQGPLGLEEYPLTFDVPDDAVFFAAATPDGATVIAQGYWGDPPGHGAIFRSGDGGVTWTEVWRGESLWSIWRLGPNHIALMKYQTGEVTLIPDEPGELTDGRLDELVPLRVLTTIEPEETSELGFGLSRAWTADRTLYVTNLMLDLRLDPGVRETAPRTALGLFNASGKLQRGWMGEVALPRGVVRDSRVFVSVALDARGGLLTDPEQSAFLRAGIFDLETGTVYPIELPGADRTSTGLLLSVREGPFARVPEGRAGCLAVASAPASPVDPVGCAAPNVLLRETGMVALVGTDEWIEVELPGGTQGWVDGATIVRMPR